MRLIFLMAVWSLLSACSRLTMQCEPPIAEELTQPLHPMREADGVDDFMPAYLHNMEQCGVCYSRYESLREAVKDE